MSEQMIVSTIVSAILTSAAFWIGRWSMRGQIQQLERDAAYYREKYKHRSGWTVGFGNYHLVSVDSGQSWIELDPKTRRFRGLADPALIAQLDGFDALTAYAKEHGAIGSRPITVDDVRVLQSAGFEVRKPAP